MDNYDKHDYDIQPEPCDREWDEAEWSRLLGLANVSRYEEIVKDMEKRTLKQVMWFIGLVERQYGTIKRSNLVRQIEIMASEEE